MKIQFAKKAVLLFLLTLIIFDFRQAVLAHRVIIFGWEKGGLLHTQSKYSGGEAVKQGGIKVFDSSGNLLLRGLSDDQGRFSFKPPRFETLKIVLSSGGHRAEWTLRPEPHKVDKPANSSAASVHRHEESDGDPSHEDVRLIVEKAVEDKLAPVLKMLAEQSHPRVSFQDIIGGLGYIMGLVGLAAYLKYGKK